MNDLKKPTILLEDDYEFGFKEKPLFTNLTPIKECNSSVTGRHKFIFLTAPKKRTYRCIHCNLEVLESYIIAVQRGKING